MEDWKLAVEIFVSVCLFIVHCWLIWSVDKNNKQIKELKEKTWDLEKEQVNHLFLTETLKAKINKIKKDEKE